MTLSNSKTRNSIRLRAASEADSSRIAALSGQLGYHASTTEITNRLRLLLPSKDQLLMVATSGHEVIGWIHAAFSMRVETPAFVEIYGLVVDESYRRSGVGKILVKRVEDWARQFNCELVRVRSNIRRSESHPFYLKLGFREIKQQTVYNKHIMGQQTDPSPK